MRRAYVLIFMILLSNVVGAQKAIPLTEAQKSACITEIKEAFANLGDEQILKFVKLQTAITTHRLAWAHLTNLKKNDQKQLKRNKNGQTLDKFEDSMKSLVEEDIKDLLRLKKTKEHEKANKAFTEYAQGLSANSTRKTLAGMSPALRGAIRSQLTDGKPSVYKVNASDMALLHLLAEGEKSYHHRYGPGVTGNLNIARMVNSSLNGVVYEGDQKNKDGTFTKTKNPKSTESTSANIQTNLNVFENVIKLKEKELNDLITGMLPSNQSACIELKNSCEVDWVKDSSLSNFLLSSDTISNLLNDKISERSRDKAFQKQLLEALHYCENWLHTDSKCLNKNFTDQHCPNCKETEEICKEPRKPVVIVDPTIPEVIVDPKNPEVIVDPAKPEVVIDPAKPEVVDDPKKIENTENNINVVNNIFIVVNPTQPTFSSGSTPLFLTMTENQFREYLKYQTQSQQGQNGIQIIPINGTTGGIIPGFNPNGGITPGGGVIPGGNNSGTDDKNNKDTKENESSKSWDISLETKMDKVFNAEGEDLFTVMTVGKKEYKGVCIQWLYPEQLKEMSQVTYISENQIKAIRIAGSSQSFQKRYAPYRKSAYEVSVNLHECSTDKELGKKIKSDKVKIERAWQGGTFNCDWNQANRNLSVCLPIQRKQVPFTPFLLNGTDGNQGF